MDDGVHRENGRLKADQYKTSQGQWLMQHQPSMKQIMSIMAERDAAIQERNMALSEKKAALQERDIAFMQRDSAMKERNNALMERDSAITALQYHENLFSNGNIQNSCPPGCQISRGMKHMHHPQQHVHHHPPHMGDAHYNTREINTSDVLPMSPVSSEATKSQHAKRTKQAKPISPNKQGPKPPRKVKRESENSNNIMFGKSDEWKTGQDMNDSDTNKRSVVSKTDWKGQDLGLNQVVYDESTMPAPVCSCTGTLRQCYKWGNGGWQSACCTTTMSVYPLPALPNKRHARIGGRKMSGSAFNKLLSRLSAEGHDLSIPVDLKDNWAKHGTNRYITIK